MYTYIHTYTDTDRDIYTDRHRHRQLLTRREPMMITCVQRLHRRSSDDAEASGGSACAAASEGVARRLHHVPLTPGAHTAWKISPVCVCVWMSIHVYLCVRVYFSMVC